MISQAILSAAQISLEKTHMPKSLRGKLFVKVTKRAIVVSGKKSNSKKGM
jgi:hypothetical protein